MDVVVLRSTAWLLLDLDTVTADIERAMRCLMPICGVVRKAGRDCCYSKKLHLTSELAGKLAIVSS
jgi:hypothetical protein